MIEKQPKVVSALKWFTCGKDEKMKLEFVNSAQKI